MEPRYEIFDHTADMGMRVFAPSLTELVRPATEGLYSMIGDLAYTSENGEPLSLAFQSQDGPAFLLRDCLDGLLFQFETRHRVAVAMEVTRFSEEDLRVTASMCPIDHDKSVFAREVKAITYHDLTIRPIPGGYEATIIVDI